MIWNPSDEVGRYLIEPILQRPDSGECLICDLRIVPGAKIMAFLKVGRLAHMSHLN